MTPLSIALALALAAQEPALSQGGWLTTGRIVDRPMLHIGVRPALFYDGTELDVAITIQVSTNLF